MFSYTSLLFLLIIYFSTTWSINVNVNTDLPVHTISDKFLSISFDSSHTLDTKWFGLNFTFIQPLAKALGRAYLRYSGTHTDETIFQENQILMPGIDLDNVTGTIFTGQQLDQLYNFAKSVGWRLSFGLNIMLRTQDGKWNSSNAQSLLNYASQRGYDMDFELGNEPDGFPLPSQFNVTINGTQIADDYRVFRNLLNSYSLYKNSIIIGPSIAAVGKPGLQLIKDFLNNNGGNYIGGLTFHFYYVNGDTATLSDWISYNNMNNLLTDLLAMNGFNYSHTWLGETADAWGDGAPNISNAYAGGFLWLDTLGLSALHGMETVIRQQLYCANYGPYWMQGEALLNNSMYPIHDYWVSLLYKKLIGSKVYNLSVDVTDLNLRLYAASAKTIANGIVVYGLRISNSSVLLDFPQFSTRQATLYLLKEGEPGNLAAITSKLNGEVLEWNPHQPGANYQGVLTNLPLEIPGYSQFFIVIEPSTESTCPDGWYKETTILNKCVQFINETQPLFGAKLACSTYGKNASILSIDNSFENAEILKSAQSNGCNQLYLGLFRNGNSWVWSNGATSTYTNWKSGFPSNDNTKNCVAIDTTSGTWYNVDCDSLQCYICQKYV